MLHSIARFYHILHICLSHHLERYLPKQGVYRVLRFLCYLHPTRYRRKADAPDLAVSLRQSLEALGPIYVKFGQTLSTRPDLLSPELITELAKLQDRVAPFPSEEAKRIIERALGAPIEALYDEFSDEVLASASVAQVHSAKLKTGESVIVKVLRPEIDKIIAKDISLMYTLAALIGKTSVGKRLRASELVSEFEKTLENELDLMNEAANASQLRVNFEQSDLIYVPEVYWRFCHRQVMTMERIFAHNINDQEAISAANVNMKALAERGVEIFFTQVFRHSFFHADMHAGNIFVYLDNPQAPQYCAIDFGIMGSLAPEDQHYLAENFLAFFNRDYRRVAELHIESGWVPADTSLTDFESAIRKVSEPIFGRPIKEISFGAFLLSLFQTAQRFHMTVQPQLMLLQKTFFNVEGLGRRLYPELDLWTTAKPVLEEWMREQIGAKALLKRLRYNAHDYAKTLPQLPLLYAQSLQQQRQTQYLLAKKQAKQSKHNKHFGLALASIASVLFYHYGLSDFWQSMGIALLYAWAVKSYFNDA